MVYDESGCTPYYKFVYTLKDTSFEGVLEMAKGVLTRLAPVELKQVHTRSSGNFLPVGQRGFGTVGRKGDFGAAGKTPEVQNFLCQGCY